MYVYICRLIPGHVGSHGSEEKQSDREEPSGAKRMT